MTGATNDKTATIPLHGIGGWLAWLIFLLMISPMIYASQLNQELNDAVKTDPESAASDLFIFYTYLAWSTWGIVSAFRVTAAISLLKFRTPRAVRVAIIMIWASFLVGIISTAWAGFLIEETLWSMISDNPATYINTGFGASLSTWYLCVSRRVRNTYYAVESPDFGSAPENPKQSKKGSLLKTIVIDGMIFLVLIFAFEIIPADKVFLRSWMPVLAITAIAYMVAFLSSSGYSSRSFKQRFSVLGPTLLLAVIYWIGIAILNIAAPFKGMTMPLSLVFAIALAWRRIKALP